jgi:hypothetical protein
MPRMETLDVHVSGMDRRHHRVKESSLCRVPATVLTTLLYLSIFRLRFVSSLFLLSPFYHSAAVCTTNQCVTRNHFKIIHTAFLTAVRLMSHVSHRSRSWPFQAFAITNSQRSEYYLRIPGPRLRNTPAKCFARLKGWGKTTCSSLCQKRSCPFCRQAQHANHRTIIAKSRLLKSMTSNFFPPSGETGVGWNTASLDRRDDGRIG